MIIKKREIEFSKNFKEKLVTETMLIKGLNDKEECLDNIARFLARVNPVKAYLSIPTRPPADKRVQAPDEYTINRAFQVFSKYNNRVEYLIGYEGNDFVFSGNAEEDILSITSVHPMREDAVQEFLTKAGADWEIISRLIREGKLIKLEYEDKNFYMRKLYKGYKR
ncbi:MAG: hypothetical protein H5T98_01185 [Syntrophomonadaceae bacterium]|nr:hypothetical protein [Syntrophomonadaceae bacterium]